MSYGDYPPLGQVKKVLVIKLRQLGDVLLTSPVFSSLQAALPEAQIDAYVYSESIPLIIDHPAIQQIISYDRNWKKLSFFARLREEWRVLRKIRLAGYDLVINLTEGDRGAIAAKYSKAPLRVGFDPKGTGLKGKKNLYTHVVKQCPNLRHTVERNLDALRRIGIFPSLEERNLFLGICPDALQKMAKVTSGPFILIHPTSRWKFKCWPIAKMKALATQLHSQGAKLVFTSGPDPEEKEMVRQISEGLDAIDLAGKISLSELAALVSLSQLLICVDSLPVHMASALKKPVVAIFGPTSEVTWGPWKNPYARIVSQALSCRPCYQDGCGGSKVSDCLATLGVDAVLPTIESLLQNSCCAPLRLKPVDQRSLPGKLALLE